MSILSKITTFTLILLGASRLNGQTTITSGGLSAPTRSCDRSAAIAGVAGANMVKIITLDATKAIYVCSVTLTSAGTAIGVLKSGTNASQPCDTTTVSITGALNLVAGIPLVVGGPQGALFRVAPGLDLCILTTTTAIGGFITYAQ